MRTSLFAIAFFAALAATHTTTAEADTDLASVLDHVDDLYADKASHSTISMHIVTDHATRDLGIEAWSKGHDRFLARILAPEKEAGTSTLKSGGNVWNYFPKINQTTKVSGSLMSGSWMGSHVTNGDLVKHARMSESYTYKKSFEGDRNGEKVLEITLDPKPNAAVVWGKVVLTVRSSDQNPTVIKYYDESKSLAQTWTYSDVKKLGGRDLPTSIKVVPAGKQSESTEIRYKSIEFNPTLNDDLFSQRSLTK